MASRLIQSSVIYRDLHRQYPIIERGEGIYLYDLEGRCYIDASGGSAAVTSIGHGVREVVEAMTRQVSQVAFVPMHLFSSRPLEELANLVAEFAPPGLNKVWFVSGGSEATENAVKLARQYHIERGARPSTSSSAAGRATMGSHWQPWGSAGTPTGAAITFPSSPRATTCRPCTATVAISISPIPTARWPALRTWSGWCGCRVRRTLLPSLPSRWSGRPSGRCRRSRNTFRKSGRSATAMTSC